MAFRQMRTIYFSYIEDFGEIEGMFEEDGTLIDYWSCNDASWRNEYFSPFMKKLGIVVDVSGKFNEALSLKAEEMFG